MVCVRQCGCDVCGEGDRGLQGVCEAYECVERGVEGIRCV